MKFSAPLSIGTNTGASGATLAITVGAAGVPAGATIFVLVTEKSTSGTDGTLADTAGNSYSKITSGSLNAAIANGRGILFAVTNCKALVNTNTITYTRNLSAASCAMSAFYTTGATGAATFTEALATATGSTGTITVTSGTLGAGRLVLGALFASGTTTAGGNATFTNAASFTTPPVEATTGGSGGSRVDGGQLFKAAGGTQVYAPTLSSTAQVWFLAVVGIIPPPDTIDLTEPAVALPRPQAKPTDFPNLLLTTLAPPPVPPDTTHILRSPLYARFPDRWPKAYQEYPPNLQSSTLAPPPPVTTPVWRAPLFVQIYPRIKAQQEYVVNLLPIQTTPVVTFTISLLDQFNWPLPTTPRAKAAEQPITPVAPLLTPNPPQPFNQDIWDSATPGKAKAYAEPFGTINPLLTPNPARPFNQYEWRSTARVPLSLKSDSYFGAFPLYSPNPPQPFNQDLWDSATLPRSKAVGEAIAGVAPLLTPNPAQPFVQSDWPLISATRKANVDDPFNLTIYIATVVVVQNPFYYRDDRTSLTARAPAAQKSDSYDPPDTLLYPNPPQPFVQSDWLRQPALPKAIGEALGTLSPLLTPNPRTPFNQYEWRTTARSSPPQKSDVYWGTFSLYSPNPAQPFSQLDWPTIRTTQKARVDDPFNLTIYLPTVVVTFTISLLDQFNWPNPALPKAKASGDFSTAGIAPLLTPNPAQPFNQDLWDAAIRAFPKATGEVVGTLSPVLTPNPSRPFAQNLWDLAVRGWPKAYADPLAAISALYNPNPRQPFHQDLWEGAAKAWPKVVGEAIGTLAPLLTPNPAQPFVQLDWTRVPATSKARVDDFVNLVPLYSVVVVQPPFYYRDEDARSFTPTRAQPPQKSDVYRGPTPLLSPNPARPFHQDLWDRPTQLPKLKSIGDVLASPNPILYPPRAFQQIDWPSSARQGPSDRSFAAGINLPLTTLAPPPGLPFSARYGQTDWPSTAVRGMAHQEYAANLLPLSASVPPPSIGVGTAIGAYPKWRRL